MESAITVVMLALDAVERRDLPTLQGLYHPEICFNWQPGLPYEGEFCGSSVARMSEIFAAVWSDLQPDAATRRLNPRLIAADQNTVVVKYEWRALSYEGARFETHALAEYKVSDGRLISASMYYHDLAGLIGFLQSQGVYDELAKNAAASKS